MSGANRIRPEYAVRPRRQGAAGKILSAALSKTQLPPFSELPIPEALLRAIADRGYDTPTPVQAAVLAPGRGDRDLLVSAPTGSGKTLAFGTAIAEDLLKDGAAASPRALVIAPTRELAAQVARELGWLYAGAKLRTVAFTGGTPMPGDLKRLRAGVDVAVGTPGRLADLVRRGALALTALRALVLDEADEMLDLGFREELEFLLAQSPTERRTLLFSATLPPAILKLAATYQRDAVRLDPRAGEVGGHADIHYLAHLVRGPDRLAAVINALLVRRTGKAIVFCRTRQGVGELHQRLVDHGFKAVALSGDRAQEDRDRALGALRDDRARVLVATNVAARGLDLPDVDLVIHADLPDNAESLTHRSGRTGRAGRKGTSMVIATPGERRKAERLLQLALGKQDARTTSAMWSAAPGTDDVRRSLEEQVLADVLGDRAEDAAENVAAAPPEEVQSLADRLRAALPERVLVARLVARELGRLPQGLPLQALDPRQRPHDPRLTPQARVGQFAPKRNMASGPGGFGPGAARPPSVRPGPPDARGGPFSQAVIFRVNLGRDAKAEPGWLLPLICRRGGVTRREVGSIRVGPSSSTFEIAFDAAQDFALAAGEPDPRAPHVTIEPVLQQSPPEHAPRRGPPRGPARGPQRTAKQ
jgi:ATP-dependent RNA helicase DeaD